MVIRGVEGSEGGDGRGDGLGEGHRVSAGHGSAELSTMDEGENVEGEFLVVSRVGDTAGRCVDCEEGGPVARQEGIAA
jgi:hypothetical protein